MSDQTTYDSPKQVFIYTRSHPRYQTSIYARVEGEKHLRESRGNVSAGGFCFECQEELPPGTQVELLFRLPGAGVWLKGRGQVLASMESADTVAVRGLFTAIDLGELGNNMFGAYHGVTGNLSLGARGHIERSLRCAKFSRGLPVLLEPTVASDMDGQATGLPAETVPHGYPDPR